MIPTNISWKVVLFICSGMVCKKPYKRYESEAKAITVFARARAMNIPAALFRRDENSAGQWIKLNSCHLAAVPHANQDSLVSAFTGAPAKKYFAELESQGAAQALTCATPWELRKVQDEARLRLRLGKKRHVLRRYNVATMQTDTVAIEGGILTRWLEGRGYNPSEVLVKIDSSRRYDDIESKLRMEEIVDDGLVVDGKRFRYLLASAGEAKQSRSTFIDENVLRETDEMLRLGITLQQYIMAAAKYDAALGLSLTGSVPFKEVFNNNLRLEDCVLLDDTELGVISQSALVVKHGRVEEERARMNKLPITDGQMYADGYLTLNLAAQMRGLGLKALCAPVCGTLADVFRSVGIEQVTDVYGTIRNVSTVKAVLHTSCVKTWNVFSSWEDYCARCRDVGAGLCIVRLEAPRHSGETSYTMLQTLVGTEEHVSALADKAIGMLAGYHSVEHAPELLSGKQREAAELYPALMDTASFSYTMRMKYAQRYMEMRGGKFAHMVQNVFIISDPTASLMKKPLLQAGECHCSWLPDGETVVMTRFPHTNESCWIRMVNRNRTVHRAAFASTGSCYVNAMDDSGLRDRWDFDGDKVTIVTDPILKEVVLHTLDTLGDRLYDWEMEKPVKKEVTQGARENAILRRISGGTVGMETDYLSRLWGTVHDRASFDAVSDAIAYQVFAINNDIDSVKGNVFSVADQEARAHWRELREKMTEEVMYGRYMYFAKYDRMDPVRNAKWDEQTSPSDHFLDRVSKRIGDNAPSELGEIDGLEDLHFSVRWLLHDTERTYNDTQPELYGHTEEYRHYNGRNIRYVNVSGVFADIVRRSARDWKRYISKEELRERRVAYVQAQAEQARLELQQWGARHDMDLWEVYDRITVALFNDESLNRRFLSGSENAVDYANTFYQTYWNVFGDMAVSELRRKMGEDAEAVEAQAEEDPE